MGKAERNCQVSARDKIAAQQAVARQADQRRRLLIVAGSVTAVIAVVVALIVFKSLSGTKSGSTATSASTVAATVGKDIAGVRRPRWTRSGPG